MLLTILLGNVAQQVALSKSRRRSGREYKEIEDDVENADLRSLACANHNYFQQDIPLTG